MGNRMVAAARVPHSAFPHAGIRLFAFPRTKGFLAAVRSVYDLYVGELGVKGDKGYRVND